MSGDKIREALKVLDENLISINTVSEWADKVGYDSSKYFSRKIRDAYGELPKEMIIRKKLEQIEDILCHSEDQIYYSIALDLGFKNDVALYKFLKRHTGKSITEYKRECEKRV